jgi:hypothetical protein
MIGVMNTRGEWRALRECWKKLEENPGTPFQEFADPHFIEASVEILSRWTMAEGCGGGLWRRAMAKSRLSWKPQLRPLATPE